MTAVYILAAIFALLALLLMLRVGVRAKYDEAGFEASAVIAFVKLKLYPAEESKKKKKKPEKEKKEKKAEEATEKVPKKGGPLSELRELWPPIKEALGKFRRKLRVDELTIHFTAGGDDAANTALSYGAASAGLGMAASFLEHNLNIKKRDFGAGFDFSAHAPSIYASIQLTLRVWQLIYIALGPLGVFLRRRKRKEEK